MSENSNDSPKLVRCLLAVLSLLILGALFACSGAGTSVVTNQTEKTVSESIPDPVKPDDATEPDKSVRKVVLQPDTTNPDLIQAALKYLEIKRITTVDPANLQVGFFGSISGDGEIVSTPDKGLYQVRLSNDAIAFVKGSGNLVSGQRISLDNVLVLGTQDYTTIVGSTQRAWVIELVSDSRWQAAIARAEAINRASKQVEIQAEIADIDRRLSELPYDEWTSGEFKTKAKFRSVVDGKINLEKEDGTIATVPLDRLNEESRRKATTRGADVGRWETRKKQLTTLLEKLNEMN